MTRLRVTDRRTLSEPSALDLSRGLCVGDLRFTDRPQAVQHATCQRCPVRAICPVPTPAPTTEPDPDAGCPNHDRINSHCRHCREWVHTHDHQPEWLISGSDNRRRCRVCHDRWHGRTVETRRARWAEVLDALDTYQVGDRYMWGLILAELDTSAEALYRRFQRRGMAGLARSLHAAHPEAKQRSRKAA